MAALTISIPESAPKATKASDPAAIPATSDPAASTRAQPTLRTSRRMARCNEEDWAIDEACHATLTGWLTGPRPRRSVVDGAPRIASCRETDAGDVRWRSAGPTHALTEVPAISTTPPEKSC